MERRGFTLIELIVVMIIMVIMAAMTLPRVLGGRSREFNHVVDQVSDLLTMYAQRTSQAENPVGITYDAERHWLVLVVLARDEDEFSDGEWLPDTTVRPVKLPEWVERPVLYADEEPRDITEQPYAYAPGRPRRTVEIALWSEDYSASLRLPPHAIAPSESSVRSQGRFDREVIDLDDIGRSREDW